MNFPTDTFRHSVNCSNLTSFFSDEMFTFAAMEKEGLFKRCLILVFGLFIMALGVALSVKANLGTSPISCVPYVYSLGFPLSMGAISIVMHVFFILLQMILLRKDYRMIQLLQLPVALAFGLFIDFAMFLESGINVSNYLWQWALCLLSCAIIAFGVFLQVKAKVTYLAGEGLAMAISKTFDMEFGKAKVGVDSTLVIIGIASSFLLLNDLQGIREGTVAAALLVGTIARIYSKNIQFVDAFVGRKSIEKAKTARFNPNAKRVITIAREFGSGGHEIGEMVAQKLGISFYDTKLIDLSAAEGGFTHEYVKEHEQKLANALLFDLYEQNYAYIDEEMPPLDTLFMVQSKVLRDICEKESCVIVGRCADYVLKNNPNCFNVFVHADTQFRIQRAINEYGIDPALAVKELERKDRERANYCRHYTHRLWGKAGCYYDLSIDSSIFGTQRSAEIIIDAMQRFMDIPSKS